MLQWLCKGCGSMFQVLMVEDQKEVRDFVKEYFHQREIHIVEAMNGYDAIELMDETIQLVLLDIMMPGIDGYEVCLKIREKYNVPIIFISALSQDHDQLKAYELGGDDYITKPFKPSLLYAKCMAIIKRSHHIVDNKISFGCFILDINKHVLLHQNIEKKLTDKEFKLLKYLLEHQGQAIPREKLLDDLWGYDYYGDGRAVDTYIRRLRKILGHYAYYIQTVVKTGYMLEVKPHENV